MTEADFQRANAEATQTIEITDFVDQADIDSIYYDKPYYLAPAKNAAKSYTLLREVMRRTKTAGIAKVVIRSRQHLAAVFPKQSALVMDLLRFAHENTAATPRRRVSETIRSGYRPAAVRA